jgi:hypothetical protein
MENKGIIYYNTNTKCIIRLLVSIHSLRKVYDGPISIISQGEESDLYCAKIAEQYDAELVSVDYGIEDGRNKAYIEACKCHQVTPYDVSIWLDADTLVLKPFAEDLWEMVEEHDFVATKFANWSTKGGIVKSRINSWSEIYPEYIEGALEYNDAINCGVFAFNKNCDVMRDWFNLAVKGRENFIADESCLQVVLHRYKHVLADQTYNHSCRYGKENLEDVKIIHYHGRNHCVYNKRKKFKYKGQLWIDMFEQVYQQNILNVQDWGHLNDSQLKRYLRKRG